MNGKNAVITGAGIFLAGLAMACSGGTSSTDGTTKNVPITTATSATPPDPNSISGDGMFAVGSQVKPGTYRTVVPEGGFMCSYSRLKNASGDPGSIISIEVANAGEQKIVDIKAADKYFETKGCGVWKKVG